MNENNSPVAFEDKNIGLLNLKKYCVWSWFYEIYIVAVVLSSLRAFAINSSGIADYTLFVV